MGARQPRVDLQPIYNGLTTLAKQGHLVRHDLIDAGRPVAVYELNRAASVPDAPNRHISPRNPRLAGNSDSHVSRCASRTGTMALLLTPPPAFARGLVQTVRASFFGDFETSMLWGVGWTVGLFVVAAWWGTAVFKKENA